MTPMIDVVFLLLIFFVWTASFQIAEMLLPADLAAATGSAEPDSRQQTEPDLRVVIQLRQGQRGTHWLINGELYDTLEQVDGKLRQLAEIGFSMPVFLDPEDDVSLGDVIDVYDLCLTRQLREIHFATSADLP